MEHNVHRTGRQKPKRRNGSKSVAKLAAVAFASGVALGWFSVGVHAADLKSAEILVIGDSQVAFHGGAAYVDFFQTINNRCSAVLPDEAKSFAKLDNLNVGVLGVRATSIDTWVARTEKGKAKICVPEKSWPVNARGFGVLTHPKPKTFVQTGKDPSYPLCQDGRSAVDAMFETVGIAPELLVFTFLGNSKKRWLRKPEDATKDAANLASQIPAHTPCVFMTSSPTFKMDENQKRVMAQDYFIKALKQQGKGCVPVTGLTEASIGKIENMPSFFKRDPKGKVKDSFHPNAEGVAAFLDTLTPGLCLAVAQAMGAEQIAKVK